jgi:predicted RNA binding protein YcfA (HicA-like mRNA interferase family)
MGVLGRTGWEFKRSKGSHHIYKHPDSPDLIVVPVHRGDIKTGLLHSVINKMGLSREEFLELL